MKLNKTIITYALLSVLAFAVDKIYALFGHGVTSPWMSNMYLYLLGAGVLVYSGLRLLFPTVVHRQGYRVFYNAYNTGIAFLMNGMLLAGILEIAGGSSAIVPWFFYTGIGCIVLVIVLFARILAGSRETPITLEMKMQK